MRTFKEVFGFIFIVIKIKINKIVNFLSGVFKFISFKSIVFKSFSKLIFTFIIMILN